MAASDFYHVHEWREGLYRIFNKVEAVHSDLIVGRDRALLFDTGYGIGDLAETVHSITDKPLYVVDSHGHVDHASGAYQFEGPIYIHSLDIPVCQEHTSPTSRAHALSIMPEEGLPKGFDRETWLAGGTGELAPIEKGHLFDLGGRTLEVIELPGHTRGSIGLLLREERILFVGDAINSYLWLFLPESTDLATYRATLAKARDIDFDVMVQAHGPRRHGKDILDLYERCANTLDYDRGLPFESALVPDAEARVCVVDGGQQVDFANSDFAAIVISPDKLDAAR